MTAPVDGTFDLVDHDGTPVTEASYRGFFLLVFFGFTHCRVVCPRALGRLTRVLERLGEAASAIQPLYITVDLARDTPARMKDFLADYHPHFRGLTGTAQQIDAAKHAFRVYAARRPDSAEPDGYKVPHTAITYLLDPEGAYRAHFAEAVSDEALEAQLRVFIGAGQRG